MKRIAVALLLVLAAAAPPSGAGAAESRHSGQVVAVDPSAGMMRFQEMIAWTGPNTGVVERTVRLTPQTEVQLVQRATTIDAAHWPNSWEEHRISLDALHPGDFVTVTTSGTDTAVALEVVRPEQ